MANNDEQNDDLNVRIVMKDDGRFKDGRSQSPNPLHSVKPSPREIAGQIANRAAGQNIFQRYLSEKSVNARLSTVRIYAQMAVKTGTVDRQEGPLIQTVKGFSRVGGLNVVDEQRAQTRMEMVTYAYKAQGRKQSTVVTRRSTKKRKPTLIDEDTAVALKQPRNESPQAYRNALLMCLLLDHSLRASEVALLKATDFDLGTGEMRFYRPKVKGTDHEWTTHKLTAATREVSSYLYGVALPPSPTGKRVADFSHDAAAEKRRGRPFVGRRVESGAD